MIVDERIAALAKDQTHLSSTEYDQQEGAVFEILGETFTAAHPKLWADIKARMEPSKYAVFRFKVPLIDMDADDHQSRRILRMIALAGRPIA